MIGYERYSEERQCTGSTVVPGPARPVLLRARRPGRTENLRSVQGTGTVQGPFFKVQRTGTLRKPL